MGMPHLSVARLIDRSSTPAFSLLTTSFRRASGWMNSGWFSMYCSTRGAYLVSLKK